MILIVCYCINTVAPDTDIKNSCILYMCTLFQFRTRLYSIFSCFANLITSISIVFTIDITVHRQNTWGPLSFRDRGTLNPLRRKGWDWTEFLH